MNLIYKLKRGAYTTHAFHPLSCFLFDGAKLLYVFECALDISGRGPTCDFGVKVVHVTQRDLEVVFESSHEFLGGGFYNEHVFGIEVLGNRVADGVDAVDGDAEKGFQVRGIAVPRRELFGVEAVLVVHDVIAEHDECSVRAGVNILVLVHEDECFKEFLIFVKMVKGEVAEFIPGIQLGAQFLGHQGVDAKTDPACHARIEECAEITFPGVDGG